MILLLYSTVFYGYIYPEGLKKVLILDFINIDKKENYQYLEDSITESVTTLLKEKFAFKEMRKSKLNEIRKANYIYRDDYHTKSVSMNLGLLGKQDVVISGGYRIETDKNRKAVIVTDVRIYDISKKNILTEFSMNGPADNRIFNSINEISKRIEKEVRPILPNKKDWEKKGMPEDSLPFFENFTFSLRGGWGLYQMGYADRIEIRQPVLTAIIRANMPFIWERLALEANLTFLRHTPSKDKNAVIEQFTIDIQNYIISGFFVLDLPLADDLFIHPKIGGGYVIQNIDITGSENKNYNNSFYAAGAGLDLSYRINTTISIVTGVQSLAEIENGEVTLLHSASGGISLKF